MEFEAKVIPEFGQNVLSVQKLPFFVDGGRVRIAGTVMDVLDKRGKVIVRAYKCSDNLYRWWPLWVGSRQVCLAQRGTSLRAAQDLVHDEVVKKAQEMED